MISKEEISAYAFKAWGFVSWLIIGAFAVLIVVVVFMAWRRKKSYNIEVRVKEEQNGQLVEVGTDLGGIFLDKKTNNRLFLLKGYKVGLMPDNLPYYLGVKGHKIVEVLRTGLKSFRYLDRPRLVTNSPTALAYNVQDQDIAFGLNTIDLSRTYKKSDFWTKIYPIIGMAFVFMLIVVALYFIFKNFHTLSDTAQAFKEAANAFAQAKSGTTVLPGGS